MTIEQRTALDALNEKAIALQNRCNRALGSLARAEQAEDMELVDRMIEEARLELE